MNKTATAISEGCLQDLYLQRGPPKNHLLVQVLAFQVSQNNPKEIILRISDKQTFLDCLLVGSYAIQNAKIISTQYSHSSQTIRPFDIVKVTDYFCKIDPSKMCHLRIIIRKMEEYSPIAHILGKPEEISQYVENNHMNTPRTLIPNAVMVSVGTEDTPIKIQENAQAPPFSMLPQVNAGVFRANLGPSNQIQKNAQNQQDPLTLHDIMAGKHGFFIGRLVRYKFGSKQAKEGPMSFLYLGFLDLNGDVVRVHLAGRIAIKESRQLKRGKVYFIKGLQLFQGDKTKGGPQIRLRERDYKIHEIQNEVIKSQYKDKYYCWQHQNQWVQSEMVDVIGVVEEIEQKITYKNANTFQEQRDVVRLIIRNVLKTVKISFWADHINLLNSFNLKKKQPILIEDIKKKKSVFLDFMAESNIIVLDEECEQWQQIEHLLPPAQQAPEPNNIKQLLQVYELQPFNSKLRVLKLAVSNINWKWIIYKMCNDCKKKVEKILQTCPDCNRQNFSYRYNCSLDLCDSTGTLTCVAFDPICQKLFGRTANDFHLLSQEQIKQLVQSLISQEYKVSIEHKNNRLILRSAQKEATSEELPAQSGKIVGETKIAEEEDEAHQERKGEQEVSKLQ